MGANARIVVRLPFRIPDKEVLDIISDCRMSCEADLQIVITLPESATGGGWGTRPFSRGGPDVFVDITAPAENTVQFREFLNALLRKYSWNGSIDKLMAPI